MRPSGAWWSSVLPEVEEPCGLNNGVSPVDVFLSGDDPAEDKPLLPPAKATSFSVPIFAVFYEPFCMENIKEKLMHKKWR